MTDKQLRRALPKDPWPLVRALLPTRASLEVRLYDFDTQEYRYVPLRAHAVIANETELRRLWRLIRRVLSLDEHWRDRDSPLLQKGPSHDDGDDGDDEAEHADRDV